jgi:beta-glucosidase
MPAFQPNKKRGIGENVMMDCKLAGWTGRNARRRLGCAGLALTLLGLDMGPSRCGAQTITAQAATARAKHLVAQMTLAEKLTQVHGFSDSKNNRIVAGVPRLGIPALRITNGPAGVGPGGAGVQLRATALPAPIALAATWDPIEARAYGKLAGEETKMLGSDLLEAPDINIVRIPQGGRTFETFGEDPWLTARITVANIQGIQGAGVLANVKHYLANNQETQRGSINEIIDNRTLHEIYMPGFKAAVQEAHVDSIMCAYPLVNGSHDCENGPLLNGTLRDEWSFGGFVMSDFGAVHSTLPSLKAGLDLELPTGHYYAAPLAKAVADGSAPMASIDEALIRRYAVMIQRGMFGKKQIERIQNDAIPVLANGAVSRRIAEHSMVLLKNDGNLLPLDSQALRTVALIGPYAVRAKSGGGGSSYVNPLYTVRPEDGIYSHMQSQKTLLVEDGADIEAAVAAARKAQIAIVMVGDDEGEDHDHSLALPERQNALVSAVAAANAKTIVVLKSGSAVLMPWLASVPAVLEAWYPGEEDGNAVADVLFGDADPGGRLPMTFPVRTEDTLARNIDQYPGQNGTVHYSENLAVGYRDYQTRQVKPLFPFGFGLSYTKFNYAGFSVQQSGSGAKPSVTVSFTVTNTGSRAGSDVPQIYVGFPHIDEGDEPPLQLKGFQKVTLNPGESKSVRLVLEKDAFSYWSAKSNQWELAKGTYKIVLAASSEDERGTETVTLP